MWCNPVGDVASRQYPPGDWRISNPFLAWYKLGTGWVYHTGNDLNLPGVQDVNQPVRAITDGVVVYAAYLSTSTWLGIVVIRHEWQGHVLFSRYAHMRNLSVKKGQPVVVGQQIGEISPTAGTVAQFEPHCHFDLSALDDLTLDKNPTNWPGAAKLYIQDHYQDPRPFMAARLVGDMGGENPVGLITKQCRVITSTALNMRLWPDVDSVRVAKIPPGATVTVSPQIKFSEDGYVWTYTDYAGVRGWVATADPNGGPWLEGFQ